MVGSLVADGFMGLLLGLSLELSVGVLLVKPLVAGFLEGSFEGKVLVERSSASFRLLVGRPCIFS
jgi:hypothetical protein